MQRSGELASRQGDKSPMKYHLVSQIITPAHKCFQRPMLSLIIFISNLAQFKEKFPNSLSAFLYFLPHHLGLIKGLQNFLCVGFLNHLALRLQLSKTVAIFLHEGFKQHRSKCLHELINLLLFTHRNHAKNEHTFKVQKLLKIIFQTLRNWILQVNISYLIFQTW